MPKMGGLALYEQLRPARPQLARAFVLVTGDIVDRRDEPAEIHVLSKPFSAAEVDGMIDRLLTDRPPDPAMSGRSWTA
jgi:hypothetical protein